ncbi:DUF6752 domain-containing protein [Nocardioides montaniterrae]
MSWNPMAQVRKRIEELEAEVQECRQVNLRLAELCDIMMELVIPIAQRDTGDLDELIARYRKDIGSPL